MYIQKFSSVLYANHDFQILHLCSIYLLRYRSMYIQDDRIVHYYLAELTTSSDPSIEAQTIPRFQLNHSFEFSPYRL